jgi:hypothetical protein
MTHKKRMTYIVYDSENKKHTIRGVFTYKLSAYGGLVLLGPDADVIAIFNDWKAFIVCK